MAALSEPAVRPASTSSRPGPRPSVPDVIGLDVGGVLLGPSPDLVLRALSSFCAARGAAAPSDGDRCADAIFRVAARAATSLDPGGYWRDHRSWQSEWAELAGIPVELAAGAWEALERSDGPDAPVWTALLPDVVEALDAFRSRGIALVAVSNSSGYLSSELEGAGLTAYFDAVVDSEVVGVRKPDRRIFEAAATAIGRPDLGSWWFVGDDPHYDVAAALAAGCGTAVLVDRLEQYAHLSYPRVRRLREVVTMLDLAMGGDDAE